MSWLDKFLIALNLVQSGGVSVPQRPTVNFIGATVSDDPSRNATNVAISGGGLAIVDITNYGGNGSGTVDNTLAMANAIAALAPEGVVYFPPGLYRFSSTQEWDANIWLTYGAAITVDATKTVTIKGAIDANEYQDIFQGAGGYVLESASRISVCWFGANPESLLTVGTNSACINKAIASAYVGDSTGDGPLNATLFFPAGGYELEKPLCVTDGGKFLRGEGQYASYLQVRAGYTGPAIVLSAGDAITQHLNDYDGTLASASIGDNGAHQFQLGAYGTAWALNGLGAFSMDLICKTSTTQTGTSYVFSSSGNGPDNSVTLSAFQILALAADLGYSNTNLGLKFTLTTNAGAVSAQTNAGVWLTDGSWHYFRFDYDGSYLRVFVDGVAATLTNADTKIAQTGTIVQSPVEGVVLGSGIGKGIASSDTIAYPPTDMRMACLRMGHVSRGSSNFTPPTGKFPEDSSTNFLVDFDVIDNVGGLLFCRYRSDVFGMMNAWIPNFTGGGQIGSNQVRDLQIFVYNGPAIEAMATPRTSVRDLVCRAQSGVLLHNNGYFSDIKDVALIAATSAWGMGIKCGPASNFVNLLNVSANGFTINIYGNAMLSACGANYWANPQYANVYLDTAYQAELSGSCFTSDEGSPYHATLGVVLKACGVVRMSGVLFGLQAYDDEYQVVIDNSKRPITQDGASRIAFDHCTFATNISVVGAIRISTTEPYDSIEIRDCMQGVNGGVVGRSDLQPYLTVDSDSQAKIVIWPNENERLPITLADSNRVLTNDEWSFGKLVLSGTLTADRNLTVPTLDNYTRTIQNETAHALLVKTASGSGVYIPPGLTGAVSCDGTNAVLDWLEGVAMRTISSGSSSTAFDWDAFVAIDKSGAYNLTLPPDPIDGQIFIGKDAFGDAGANTKTFTANAGQTVDGGSHIDVVVNYGRVALTYNLSLTSWLS